MRILFVLLAAAALCTAAETEIRVVYDNTSAQTDFEADWGFAALVTHRGRNVMFDAGANAGVFGKNFAQLGIDARSIPVMLVSHAHGDHTGGIPALRRLNPALVVHDPKRAGPFEVAPGVYSTGIIEGTPVEQALVIETARGLVVVTGCSHPGIVKMVEAAEKQRGKDSVRLLVGGFHMLKDSPEQIAATVSRLKQLKVEAIMPTHCTGDLAIARFREAFGAKFDATGAGKRIALD